jgi:hypothetical protein
MTLLLLATRSDVHEEALAAANALAPEPPLPGGRMNAPSLDDIKAWVTRLWDTAVGAIEAAWEDGAGAAQHLVERFGEELRELRTSFADGAAAVTEMVSEKLAAYVRTLTRRLLRLFEGEITIASRRFEVRGVTVQQRVKMTGSLKASLSDLCSLVSEGEINVTATYQV